MLHYEGSHLLRLVGIVPSITAFILSFSFVKSLVNGKWNLWASQMPWENLGFSYVISVLKSQISSCLCLYPSVRCNSVYTRFVCECNKRHWKIHSFVSFNTMREGLCATHLIPVGPKEFFGLVPSFSRIKFPVWLFNAICLIVFSSFT